MVLNYLQFTTFKKIKLTWTITVISLTLTLYLWVQLPSQIPKIIVNISSVSLPSTYLLTFLNLTSIPIIPLKHLTNVMYFLLSSRLLSNTEFSPYLNVLPFGNITRFFFYPSLPS